MCRRHTAKLMTSKATSSYPESRLTPSFSNGLRQLLLLQEKSASNPLFQGRQEHRSNVGRGGNDARRVFQEGSCSSLARSLSYPEGLLSRSAQRCTSVLLPQVTDFELLRCAENSCNLHYTTRLKLWLNATMISIPTLTSCYESSAP